MRNRLKRYQHYITLQSAPTVQDSEYTDFKSVSAAIVPVSGREFIAGLAVQSEITHQIFMWYTDGVKPNMRVKYGTRNFEIMSVINIEETSRELKLYCKELFING